MPTFFNLQDEEDDKKLQEQQQQSGGMPLSQQTAFDDGDSGKPAKGTPTPTSSGRFTPIQKYIEANRGGVKGTYVDPLQQEASQAKTGLDTAKTQFSNEVSAGSVIQDKDLVDQAVKDASSVASDPDKLAAAQRQRDAQYTGPEGFNYSLQAANAASQARQASDKIGKLGSESGRMALIDNQYKARPAGTRGERKLDQLLMSNDPDTRQGLLDLQSQYGTLGKEVDDAVSAGNLQAADAKTQTNNARDYFRQQITEGRLPEWVAELQDRVSAYGQDRQNYLNELRGSASQGQFRDVDFDRFGLTEGSILGNGDLSGYVTEDPRSILNRTSVAREDERADLAALAQLAGLDNPLSNEAGTPVIANGRSGVNFDTRRFREDQANLQAGLDRDLANAIYRVNAVDPENTETVFHDRDADGQITYQEALDTAREDREWVEQYIRDYDLNSRPGEADRFRNEREQWRNNTFMRPFNDIINAVRQGRTLQRVASTIPRIIAPGGK